MIDAAAAPAGAPRINALGKLWLREIGIEKLPAGVSLRQAPATAVPVAAEAAATPVADSAAVHDVALAAAPKAAPAGDAVSQAAPAAETQTRGRPQPPGSAAKPARRDGRDYGKEVVEKARAAENAAAAATLRRQSGLAEPVAAGPRLSEAELSALDLDSLRAHVVACTACGLCAGRRNAVFGEGARTPRWMVVGEAPGEQEDRKGEPFVGRAGQLLDEMLRAVGMDRQADVFIANVIKCRPPANRNPAPEEIAACSPYLMRQIALLKPERILVLGRFAAQTLLGSTAAIGSLRGRVHTLDTPDGRSIPMVVSYHPAYLLRSPVEKARAWQDLRLAASLH